MSNILETPIVIRLLDKCQYEIEQIVGRKVALTAALKFPMISTQQLMDTICDVCEVSWDMVVADSRKRPYVLARHLYCHFAITLQRKSTVALGLVLNRDHTTIINARQKVLDMIEANDPIYMPAYEEIKYQLNKIAACAE